MTRKFALVLVALGVMLCAITPFCVTARAVEYSWARVTKDGVNLYADENCDKAVFVLEKSYYVEILDAQDNVYQVCVMQNRSGFPAVLGYVRKIEVTPVEVTPLEPAYPTEQIYVTADSAQLKLLPLNSSENVIVAVTTQKLNYYGSISYYGKDWYYVYCAGKFGYVDVNSVSKPAIAPHPTPLETAKPVISPQDGVDEPGTPNDEQQNKTPTAEILLIVFVVLLAGGLTLALFLPGNGKKTDVFEQDI